METDFRAFFLLVETTIEIRRNSIFKKHKGGSLLAVEETDFPARGNHFFFSIFQRLLSPFFRLVEKYFSMKSFIPAGETDFLASGNRFCLLSVFPFWWKQGRYIRRTDFS